jgi:hypothetical protein
VNIGALFYPNIKKGVENTGKNLFTPQGKRGFHNRFSRNSLSGIMWRSPIPNSPKLVKEYGKYM